MTFLEQLKSTEGVTVSEKPNSDNELIVEVPSSDRKLVNTVQEMFHMSHVRRLVKEPEYAGVARFRITPEDADAPAVTFHNSCDEVVFSGTDFAVKRSGKDKITITTGHHEFELDNHADANTGFLTITLLNNGDRKHIGCKVSGNSVHLTDSRHAFVLKDLK